MKNISVSEWKRFEGKNYSNTVELDLLVTKTILPLFKTLGLRHFYIQEKLKQMAALFKII